MTKLNGTRRGKTIAVIGAGVVGLAVALRLLRDGYAVRLYDPKQPGTETSFGNAALIMTAQISPLSAPGIWKKVPKMLTDPEGPLVVRWPDMPRLMPWFLRFLSNSNWTRYRRIGAALTPLVTRSLESWRALMGPENAALFRQDGLFYVYRKPENFQAGVAEAAFRKEFGIPSEVIPAEELRQMEPSLAPGLAGGVLYTDSAHTTNPGKVSAAMLAAFIAEGGVVRSVPVSKLEPRPSGPVRILHGEGEDEADEVVVSAGIWSPELVRGFGVKPMLAAERGYHLLLPQPGVDLRRPLGAGDDKFIITPLDYGVRLAGTAEFADRDAPPDWRRSDVLLKLARRLVPGLGEDGASRWMGRRPSTPDGLPLIGRTPRAPQIICAFGHGHLGLTLAAVTSEIVSGIVAEEVAAPPVEALSPARF